MADANVQMRMQTLNANTNADANRQHLTLGTPRLGSPRLGHPPTVTPPTTASTGTATTGSAGVSRFLDLGGPEDPLVFTRRVEAALSAVSAEEFPLIFAFKKALLSGEGKNRSAWALDVI